MEVAIVSQNALRLKGKNTSILVNPSKDVNAQASAVLLFQRGEENFAKVEGLRLVISGAGEYEVGGVKITGFSSEEGIVYSGEMDGSRFVVGTSKGIEKVSSKLDETPVLIVEAQEDFNPSVVSTLSPSVCFIYGEHAPAALKALGKDSIGKTSKYNLKGDKLPEETEVVYLG